MHLELVPHRQESSMAHITSQKLEIFGTMLTQKEGQKRRIEEELNAEKCCCCSLMTGLLILFFCSIICGSFEICLAVSSLLFDPENEYRYGIGMIASNIIGILVNIIGIIGLCKGKRAHLRFVVMVKITNLCISVILGLIAFHIFRRTPLFASMPRTIQLMHVCTFILVLAIDILLRLLIISYLRTAIRIMDEIKTKQSES